MIVGLDSIEELIGWDHIIFGGEEFLTTLLRGRPDEEGIRNHLSFSSTPPSILSTLQIIF